jgi:ribosomal protein S18 acetylase RimI-like enzyme
MVTRNGPDVEERLRQTSLYRPELDLVVVGGDGTPAAYGLFWFDPVTATGLVEPMRTEDEHQRRGLARHILTSGIDLLADVGAVRIKIAYEPTNLAARSLYRDIGFRSVRQCAVVSRSR